MLIEPIKGTTSRVLPNQILMPLLLLWTNSLEWLRRTRPLLLESLKTKEPNWAIVREWKYTDAMPRKPALKRDECWYLRVTETERCTAAYSFRRTTLLRPLTEAYPVRFRSDSRNAPTSVSGSVSLCFDWITTRREMGMMKLTSRGRFWLGQCVHRRIERLDPRRNMFLSIEYQGGC